jgi:hypothetical protein
MPPHPGIGWKGMNFFLLGLALNYNTLDFNFSRG